MKMTKRRLLAKCMAFSLVLSLVCPLFLNGSTALAASTPKLSITKATITVGASKKIAVSGVKASAISKTTWSISDAKVAKISKKAKNSVTLVALKKGTAVLKAKIKVGKKTYTKTCNVVVNAKAVPTAKPTVKPTAVPTVKPTAVPTPTPAFTSRPLTKVTLAPVPTSDATVMATTQPQTTVNPAKAVTFSANFDSLAVGKKTVGGDVAETFDGVRLRLAGTDKNSDLLEVVSGGAGGGNAIKVKRPSGSTAQGALIDLTNSTEPGGTYVLTAYVKFDEVQAMNNSTGKIMISQQLTTTETSKEQYANLGYSSLVPKDWVKITATISIPDDMYSYGVYIESQNGGGLDIFIDNMTLTQTAKITKDTTIPSLFEAYKTIFPIFGVGAGSASLEGVTASQFIKSQYNALTLGNEMKPDAILGQRNLITLKEAQAEGYVIPDAYKAAASNINLTTGELGVPKLNFANIDKYLQLCKEKGLKLRAHTLVWHEQTPIFFFQQNFKTASGTKYNVTADVMNTRLEFYIRTVMEHVLKSPYADVVYAWDVVNEYLHSSDAATRALPTYYQAIYDTADKTYTTDSGMTVTPSYVKYAFQIAHDELVKNKRLDIGLFYNDFNEYDVQNDIIHLTDWINRDGEICNGIGMQAHLNYASPTADKYANMLEFFSVNSPNLEIQITELDIMKTSKYISDSAVTPADLCTDQQLAAKYKDITRAVVACQKKHNNITAFILWSLYDGVSWRPKSEPCVFRGLYDVKAPFYALIDLAKEMK